MRTRIQIETSLSQGSAYTEEVQKESVRCAVQKLNVCRLRNTNRTQGLCLQSDRKVLASLKSASWAGKLPAGWITLVPATVHLTVIYKRASTTQSGSPHLLSCHICTLESLDHKRVCWAARGFPVGWCEQFISVAFVMEISLSLGKLQSCLFIHQDKNTSINHMVLFTSLPGWKAVKASDENIFGVKQCQSAFIDIRHNWSKNASAEKHVLESFISFNFLFTYFTFSCMC